MARDPLDDTITTVQGMREGGMTVREVYENAPEPVTLYFLREPYESGRYTDDHIYVDQNRLEDAALDLLEYAEQGPVSSLTDLHGRIGEAVNRGITYWVSKAAPERLQETRLNPRHWNDRIFNPPRTLEEAYDVATGQQEADSTVVFYTSMLGLPVLWTGVLSRNHLIGLGGGGVMAAGTALAGGATRRSRQQRDRIGTEAEELVADIGGASVRPVDAVDGAYRAMVSESDNDARVAEGYPEV